VARDLDRLAAAAHYVIARTEPSELGATKLNKILWFADIDHYRRHGRTITGLSEYVRMPRGPVPDGISHALDILKEESSISERPARVYTYTRREFVWLKEPGLSRFDATEIDTLNVFIDIIRKQPAGFVSDVTHDDALWQELKDGNMMPVRAGAIITRPPSQEELEWAEAAE
jgi:hypothetical protein